MVEDMKVKYLEYDFLKSFERIDEIIASSDNSFEELDKENNVLVLKQ